VECINHETLQYKYFLQWRDKKTLYLQSRMIMDKKVFARVGIDSEVPALSWCTRGILYAPIIRT